MKINVIFIAVVLLAITGCFRTSTSDDRQSEQQERILQEGTSKVGMPAIRNFRERNMMKTILELRDQSDYITYTYLENLTPTVVHGYTALGGKFTYLGVTIGYPIPYATQFTNPQKFEYSSTTGGRTLPQADPNSLFSPASADGTWIMMKDNNGDAKVQYIEPKIATFTYKLPMD